MASMVSGAVKALRYNEQTTEEATVFKVNQLTHVSPEVPRRPVSDGLVPDLAPWLFNCLYLLLSWTLKESWLALTLLRSPS